MRGRSGSHRDRVSLPICKIALKTNTPPSEAYPRQLLTWGDHIRKKRLDQCLLQKDIALILKVNPDTIYNWENNRTDPELVFLPKIIEFLGYAPYFGPCRSLGEKIAKFRQSMGISQKSFAKLLGINPSTVERWENNSSKPGFATDANQGVPTVFQVIIRKLNRDKGI